jgi:hypothetical protein
MYKMICKYTVHTVLIGYSSNTSTNATRRFSIQFENKKNRKSCFEWRNLVPNKPFLRFYRIEPTFAPKHLIPSNTNQRYRGIFLDLYRAIRTHLTSIRTVQRTLESSSTNPYSSRWKVFSFKSGAVSLESSQPTISRIIMLY